MKTTSMGQQCQSNQYLGKMIAKTDNEAKAHQEEIQKIRKKMLDKRNLLSIKDVKRQQAKIDTLELKIDSLKMQSSVLKNR